MRALIWIGVASLILGILSFFIPIASNQRESVVVGSLSVGVETRRSKMVPALVSGALIFTGIGLIAGGRPRR